MSSSAHPNPFRGPVAATAMVRAFDDFPMALVLTDAANRFVRVNKAACAFLGHTERDLIGRSESELLTEESRDQLAIYGEGGLTTAHEWTFVKADLSTARTSVRSIRLSPGRDRTWLILSLIEDIAGGRAATDEASALAPQLVRAASPAPESAEMTADIAARGERALSAERALFLATHDALTGLPARSALVERINALSSSEDRAATLLLLDLDDFSHINDGLGHEVGDAVLLEVAARIADAFPGWMVARHGGDEFGVLSPTVTDAKVVDELGQRVHAALDTDVQVGPYSLRVSASVGVALATYGSSSSLIGDAHSALSQAKVAGSGQTRMYDARLRRQGEERLRIQDGLRVALDAHELHVDYQPIVSLAARHVIGAEALLRWTHARWGHVRPSEFIPIAERSGLIGPIGQWVMTTACNDVLSLQRNHGLYVAVNVSARQLVGPNFADWVELVLDRSGLPPSALIVEVTESALMDDIPTIRLAFDRLRSQGVRVALDDFGTGYSSLARLQVLPVDVIKLDRAFVTDVDVREEARGMAAAILQMSSAIGAAIIAEGVETQAEADTLLDLGYEMAQGYLLARPMAIADLRAMVGSDVGEAGTDEP
jgi:diguanylate cyclase (GGDEF)-like protein/PAS domain S-box-containing protein